jgi:hypothetical protein
MHLCKSTSASCDRIIVAMPTSPPPITFDPVTRAAQYVEVVVTANAVDPVTGQNPGSVDTTTPLAYNYIQGGPSGGTPAAVTITEVAQTPEGARILRLVPGVLAVGANTQPWSVRISAAGRTGITSLTGSTPPPVDASGVSWNGVGPQATQPG